MEQKQQGDTMESLWNRAERACADADWMESKMGKAHPACKRERRKARVFVALAWGAVAVQGIAVLVMVWAAAVVALVW